MTFATPAALGVAAAAAFATVALHVIATRRQPPLALPTARFVDELTAHAASRAMQLSDMGLLLLRVLALLALGMGFAGPRLAPSARTQTIWLVDHSRAVGAMDEVRRAVVLAPGDVTVLFDSVARAVPSDSLALTSRSAARGSLSAALGAALRELTRAQVRAESVTIVVVSPSAVEEVDSATALLKASMPGTVRWIRVAAAGVRPTERRTTRKVTAADSVWTRADDRVLVLWPADTAPIAVRAVWTERTTLVAPLGRWPVGPGIVVARWEDGAPAVVERALGRGCVREVGVRVPEAGDVHLGAAYRAFDATLGVPCGNPRLTVDSSWRRPSRATTPVLLRAAPVLPLARWLLVLGLLLLVAELFARRRNVT